MYLDIEQATSINFMKNYIDCSLDKLGDKSARYHICS